MTRISKNISAHSILPIQRYLGSEFIANVTNLTPFNLGMLNFLAVIFATSLLALLAGGYILVQWDKDSTTYWTPKNWINHKFRQLSSQILEWQLVTRNIILSTVTVQYSDVGFRESIQVVTVLNLVWVLDAIWKPNYQEQQTPIFRCFASKMQKEFGCH